jgi:hypothetical protein
MHKNTKVQTFATLAIGALLGFAAASGKLDVFGRASLGAESTRKLTATEMYR